MKKAIILFLLLLIFATSTPSDAYTGSKNDSMVIKDFYPYSIENTTDGAKDVYVHMDIEGTNKTDVYTLTVTRTGFEQKEVFRQEISTSSSLRTGGFIGKEPMESNIEYSWDIKIFKEREDGSREVISSRTYKGPAWILSSQSPNIQITGVKTEKENGSFWPFKKTAIFTTIKNGDEKYGFHGKVYMEFTLSSDKEHSIERITYFGTLGPGQSTVLKIGEIEGSYSSIDWNYNSQSI